MQIELDDLNGSLRNNEIPVSNLQGNSLIISPQLFDYLKEFNLPLIFKQSELSENRDGRYSTTGFYIKIYNLADSYIEKATGISLLENLKNPAHLLFINERFNTPVSESLLFSMGVSTPEDIRAITKLTYKLNAVMRTFFERRNVELVSFITRFLVFEGKFFIDGDFRYDDLLLAPVSEDKKIVSHIKKQSKKSNEYYLNFITKVLE
ncbi:hypothetical protein MASR2M39_03420 [Ignavibacteriales bacterium]